MKNLKKIVCMLSVGVCSAGFASDLKHKEIAELESSLPAGLQINAEGEVVKVANKAMIDIHRPVGGTSIRYYSSAASPMHSIGGDYSYVSPGCRASVSGGISLDEAVDLPLDTKIVSFTAYGLDNNSTQAGSAILYTTNIATGDLDIYNSYSSGNTETPGRYSIGGFLDLDRTYNDSLFVRLSSNGTEIDICGYRIGFVPPDVASDIIFVDNFYR